MVSMHLATNWGTRELGFRAKGLLVHIAFLEGQGDLVSSLIIGIIRVAIWTRGVINLLTESP